MKNHVNGVLTTINKIFVIKNNNMEDKCYQSTNEDLRKSALEHYEELSNKCCHWSSNVPRAINFYYDYKEMNLWEKIKLAFKK